MIPRVRWTTDPNRPVSGRSAGPLSGLLRRLAGRALVCYLVFGAGALIFEGFRGFLGLTCSALVVMIGHLWLERIVDRLLRPGPPGSAHGISGFRCSRGCDPWGPHSGSRFSSPGFLRSA